MPRNRRRDAGGSRDSSPSEETAPDMSSVTESLEQLAQKGALPKMAVFDLDYTLWPLWVDTHVDTPLKRKGNAINKVIDRYGTTLSFFPHVASILFFCRRHGIKIAAASRTSAPTAARQALNGLILLEDKVGGGSSETPRKAWDLFDFTEIYPGSKLTHFRKLHADSGVAYEDCLFFDDESRNAEVSKLGVQFVLVGHSGLDLGTFTRAVGEWRAKRAVREGHGTDADPAAKV
ncbi:unnamed protein product [Parajaminaea phylloscopi]